MASLKERLKDILLRDKLIQPHDLKRALSLQEQKGGELSKILVELKLISEEDLTRVLSEGLGVTQISLARIKIDPAVICLISKKIAEQYNILPISLLGENLTLVMADPLNIFVIDNIKTLTGYTINPIIARPTEILEAIAQYYTVEKDVVQQEAVEEETETFDEIMQDIHDIEDLELVGDSQPKSHGGVEEIVDEAPIIKLTDTIIQQAVLAKASDIFIEPMLHAVRIRYRIDGVIREIDSMSKVLHFPIISRIKVIANLDIAEHRLPQDGRFKTIISGQRAVDFRVSILPTALGEKAVLRVLDQSNTILVVDKLGFESSSLKRLKECIVKPHGMILTCGPTGSGKTTTLYSILAEVNSPEKNIVTVEDPVEYQMKGINQVNIKPSMGLTFSSSLRSILRQDPDVILIGEIRDAETLDIAVKAALTGHLVLSSLHTTTAAGSITRMVNMGIEPFLICSAVLVIIAQRLLRKVCPKCVETYVLELKVAKSVGLEGMIDLDKPIEFVRGKGCKHCLSTGYKGRVGITEVLVLTSDVKELILKQAGEIKIKNLSRKEGMKTMREDSLRKALEGLTTLEEVLRITAPDEKVL